MSSSTYRPQRIRNLFEPSSTKPYRISRSKLENFVRCARCFYLDRRLGLNQPEQYPLTLNTAVDELLKTEFDSYREAKTPHPVMVTNGVDAVPFAHPELARWRDALHGGVMFHHSVTNFLITGAPDDIWVNSEGELIVVDYKATSRKEAPTLDESWQQSYKRQLEIYQWLLIKNGFQVSRTCYVLYCNAQRMRDGFFKRLEFDFHLLSHEGDNSWIESVVIGARHCLESNLIPEAGEDCDYCRYIGAAQGHLSHSGATH